ncbi:MAG: thiamine pyrophosphate-dependent enzyme [Candidatus Angelobacter sp.]
MAAKNKNKRTTKPVGRKRKHTKSKPLASTPKDAGASLAVLNPDKLKELYSSMVKCRMLEEKVLVTAHGDGQSGRGTGREALLVGATAHLLAEDAISMTNGGFLASFIRGTPLKLIFAQMFTAKDAAPHTVENNGTGYAAQFSMATGMTLAPAMKDKAKVALVFPGEDTAALGFHRDSLTLAAKHKLPLVCLIESSSFSEPLAGESHAADKDGSPDTPHVPRIVVDGIDAVAIFRVAQEAVRRARAGHGPSLIECVMPGNNSAHTTPVAGRENPVDPIAFMEQYLRRRSLWSDEWQRKIIADFAKEMKEAASAKQPWDSKNHFDHVYSLDGATSLPPISSFLHRTGSS